MKAPRNFGRFAAALLAVLIAAAGAPVALCAAMPDCPMSAPASHCHAAPGAERHCAPPSVQEGDDCCVLVAVPPATAAATTEAPGPLIVEAPEPMGVATLLVATPPAPSEGGWFVARSAGRALLSLHQTFLI
jgi:hypothetical protein